MSMMTYELLNITVLNVKDVDCRCVSRNMTRNDAINRLNNSKWDDKGTLWIWNLFNSSIFNDVNVNKYKAKCGAALRFWENKG